MAPILAVVISLRRARLHRGLSMKALAEAAGTTEQTIWRIETGLQRPRPSTRLAIATALGLPIADIRELANGDDNGPGRQV